MRNQRRLSAVLLLCFVLRPATAGAEAKPWDHGDLQIGPDQRTIVHADGTPFFWLGDTAWMMIHRASDEEVDCYYANRSALGFNVTLQVALGEIGEWNQPNRNGDRPFHDGDVGRPNEPYWRFVDSVIDRAAQYRMYVALLPTWGRWVIDQQCLRLRPLPGSAVRRSTEPPLGARRRPSPHRQRRHGLPAPVAADGQRNREALESQEPDDLSPQIRMEAKS